MELTRKERDIMEGIAVTLSNHLYKTNPFEWNAGYDFGLNGDRVDSPGVVRYAAGLTGYALRAFFAGYGNGLRELVEE